MSSATVPSRVFQANSDKLYDALVSHYWMAFGLYVGLEGLYFQQHAFNVRELHEHLKDVSHHKTELNKLLYQLRDAGVMLFRERDDSHTPYWYICDWGRVDQKRFVRCTGTSAQVHLVYFKAPRPLVYLGDRLPHNNEGTRARGTALYGNYQFMYRRSSKLKRVVPLMDQHELDEVPQRVRFEEMLVIGALIGRLPEKDSEPTVSLKRAREEFCGLWPIDEKRTEGPDRRHMRHMPTEGKHKKRRGVFTYLTASRAGIMYVYEPAEALPVPMMEQSRMDA